MGGKKSVLSPIEYAMWGLPYSGQQRTGTFAARKVCAKGKVWLEYLCLSGEKSDR